MSDNPSLARKEWLEASIRDLRESTMKELDSIDEDYENENKPWIDTFRILEAYNLPDHDCKAQFEAISGQTGRFIKSAREAVIAAMDAMERDMRASHDEFEKRIHEEGEPSSSRIAYMQKSFRLGDYLGK